LKYFICIDAIALDYRVNLLVWYLLHWQSSQNLLICISVVTAMNMLATAKTGSPATIVTIAKRYFSAAGISAYNEN
jgi:hypothetical protein